MRFQFSHGSTGLSATGAAPAPPAAAPAAPGAEVVALNLRQWCSQVFRYAVATLRADHDPASALRGAVIRPPVNHSRPMDRDEIAAFLRKLRGFGGHRTTVIALRLLLLTFVRTIEMRKAEWTEVDLAAAEWRIPAEKMKMRRLHIVPLSTQAVALLTELKGITGAGRWLFPNHRRPHDVMSATTVCRSNRTATVTMLPSVMRHLRKGPVMSPF